ncbi:MAG: urate hydroxylase PuuD [Bacteroidota bacterium]
MEFMDILSVLFRWIHVVAGILWIGLLYWFNWMNIPFNATLDGETRKKIMPELGPRVLYFFRWGAVWTWVVGILLLAIVFYHGGLMFEQGVAGWSMGSWVMLAVVFLIFPLYDALAKSGLGKNLKAFGAVAFVLIAAIEYLMIHWGEFSYRAYNIHVGAMFGTLMISNVWMRIWPVQKKVLPVVKEGGAPDAALMALAAQRSRHNTYMSVPLVWTMINAHTVVPGGDSWLWLLGVTLVGWLGVTWLYSKSMKVKGF